MSAATSTPLLEIDAVTKRFDVGHGETLQAVDDVSLSVSPGEVLGLVGESGCGKSTLARLVLRLYEPTAGAIRFDGVDVTHASRRALRRIRRDVALVFQDPYASLNPRRTVADIVAEPLRIHRLASGRTLDARVAELLERVGLAAEHGRRYPHEFSGGQRQRIGLARALATEPRLLICDEPVSALDVSIQAQILNLLRQQKDELGLTLLFIAHDLGVVHHVSDRVAVMYLGRIVETGPAQDIFQAPRHPYTAALLSAVPIPDPDLAAQRAATEIILEGDVPSPISPPTGCHFHPRCPHATRHCRNERPTLVADGAERQFACYHPR